MGETFQHAPLEGRDTIRLLRLESGLPLRGTIEHHALSKAPLYRALSYTWAYYKPDVISNSLWPYTEQTYTREPEGAASFIILLNGKSHRLLKNLYLFLNAICKKADRTKVLWCDYLCIDQANVHERNHQVSMMGEIYSRAVEVLAWLGNDVELDLDRLSAARPCCGIPPDLQVTDAGYADQIVALNERCDRMMCHPYWKRAWITQEISLARKLIISSGLSSCPMDVLENLSKWPAAKLQGRKTVRMSSLSGKLRAMVRNNKDTVTTRLEELFHDYASSECADFHDKVYSLIALARDGDEFPVDYNTTSPEFCCLLSLVHRELTDGQASIMQIYLRKPLFRLQFLFLQIFDTGQMFMNLSELETWQIYELSTSQRFEQAVGHRYTCPNCDMTTTGEACPRGYQDWYQVWISIATSILNRPGAVKACLSLQRTPPRWIIWAEWPLSPDIIPDALLDAVREQQLHPVKSGYKIEDAIRDVNVSFRGRHRLIDEKHGLSGVEDSRWRRDDGSEFEKLRQALDKVPTVRLSDYPKPTEDKERSDRPC